MSYSQPSLRSTCAILWFMYTANLLSILRRATLLACVCVACSQWRTGCLREFNYKDKHRESTLEGASTGSALGVVRPCAHQRLQLLTRLHPTRLWQEKHTLRAPCARRRDGFGLAWLHADPQTTRSARRCVDSARGFLDYAQPFKLCPNEKRQWW